MRALLEAAPGRDSGIGLTPEPTGTVDSPSHAARSLKVDDGTPEGRRSCEAKVECGDRPGKPLAQSEPRSVAHIYERYFDFVWRNLRRLGVPRERTDDAAQEVFVVIHRQLPGFAGRSSLKTWIFGIVLRVASTERRQDKRAGTPEPLSEQTAATTPSPLEETLAMESVRLLEELLLALPIDRRSVFVLSELEELTVPEIAEAVGIHLNTAYSRLRIARAEFDAALARHRKRGERRRGR